MRTSWTSECARILAMGPVTETAPIDPVAAADGGRDAAQALVGLFAVVGDAGLPGAVQRGLDRPRLDDGELGAPPHARQRRRLAGGVLERQHDLAERGAVGGLAAAHPGGQRDPGGGHPVEVHHLAVVEDAEVHDQAGAQGERVQVLERGLAQPGPLQGDAAELEQPQADPVAAAVPLQPAHRAQLVRQPVHGRLGQADPVADLAQAEGVVAAVERGEDRLKPAHHRAGLAVLVCPRLLSRSGGRCRPGRRTSRRGAEAQPLPGHLRSSLTGQYIIGTVMLATAMH